MIEEIKKEIKALEHTTNELRILGLDINIDYVSLGRVLEILDKYKNQKEYLIVDKKMFSKRLNNQLSQCCEPDCEDFWLAGLEDRANEGDTYKEMYEELKKMYIGGFPNYVYEREVTIQELEQKHNIERIGDINE